MATKTQTDTVEDIMSSPVVSVEMDDTLEVVKEIFDSVWFHHLLVVSSSRLVGVLSDRDYLKAISPNVGTISESRSDLETLNRRAHQVMSRNLITLRASASIVDAIILFNTNNVSCIPVVNADNQPVGIVSWRDVLNYMVAEAA
ncbi:MAG: acetoin utilization protein AcuB [Pseudomonadales bacterium]|jgi:acetoin utilization protein AcuB